MVFPMRIWRIDVARFGAALAVALVLVGGAGCDRSSSEPDAKAKAVARDAVPSDPALAAVYERSCRTCHSHEEAKAPLTGFAPHWSGRLSQGMPTLLAHVRDGFNGMPARGYCNDCTDATYEALIRFMSANNNP